MINASMLAYNCTRFSLFGSHFKGSFGLQFTARLHFRVLQRLEVVRLTNNVAIGAEFWCKRASSKNGSFEIVAGLQLQS